MDDECNQICYTTRNKKRWSFQIDTLFQVDCTHVIGDAGETFEVEIELTNIQALRCEIDKLKKRQANQFLNIAATFLNHVRLLVHIFT